MIATTKRGPKINRVAFDTKSERYTLAPRCEKCRAIMLIGETGLVCPKGHGKIITAHDTRALRRQFPELRIRHRLRRAERFNVFRQRLLELDASKPLRHLVI